MGLVFLSVGLMVLAYPPLGQFYTAWVSLVPWLLLVATARTPRGAFWWSWLTGTLVFAANMGWVAAVSGIGAVALMIYLGLYFAIAAKIIRGVSLIRGDRDEKKGREPFFSVAALLLIPTVWVSLEWVRGNLFTGLPWLFIGHTQTPALAMCQIADFSSAYGVGFWVVMVNVLVAQLILARFEFRTILKPIVATACTLSIVLAYGLYRLNQDTSYPGPTVMVVQPNFPQQVTGSKGASLKDLAEFHLDKTAEALEKTGGKHVDLIAWSETMMPPMGNDAYLQALAADSDRGVRSHGELYIEARRRVMSLAAENHAGILAGAVSFVPELNPDGSVKRGPDKLPLAARYNSANYIEPTGRMHPENYSKIHLVPFGEFIPFKHTIPFLYNFFNLFNPYGGDYYSLHPGEKLTVFPLETEGGKNKFRFVTPICFEDTDSVLVARMFRGDDGTKRADFIINITNDGWFSYSQMPQHFQLAQFRSIENRVPTARCVNTGVSGFIDPCGRPMGQIEAGTAGAGVTQLTLDRRITFYTKYGNIFIWICLGITSILTLKGMVNGWQTRKNRKKSLAVGR